METNGILLVDKPAGWTSFDVVARLRGVVKQATGQKTKVGHTGTLDPLATGLLLIVFGSYCRRASEYSGLDKTYEVTMKLGETSSTGDAEGVKSEISNVKPDDRIIAETLESFLGESEQIPPNFSAVKVGGKRAYKLARDGRSMALEPRKINIFSINAVEYEYPYISFTAEVSSGTYIRSLVDDIGKKLSTGAYLYKLRRSRVGAFDVANALKVPLKEVSIDHINEGMLKD